MIFNCSDKEKGKGFYLERAAKRLEFGLEDDGCVLNIEPYNFRKGEKWTGIWEIDLLLDRPEMKAEDWEQADTIFTAISNIPERLKHFKTHLLFQASDPEIHRRIPEIIPDYDVVFCGSFTNPCYSERRRVHDLISKHCRFRDAGKGKSVSDYVKELNASKIQFIRSMNTYLADGELAQRFFEGLAIGIDGREKALKFHTYENRLKTICEFASSEQKDG